MPLPTPNPGESTSAFITRCANSDTMKTEYPDGKQRYALCWSQAERAGRKNPRRSTRPPK